MDTEPVTDATSEVAEKNDKGDLSKKIKTAVKFLQNPRVQETPLSQRKAFLSKKGLSPEEISMALKESGIPDQVIEAGIPPSRLHYQNGAIPSVNDVHYSARWRDYFMVAVIGGGFGYSLVHLVKTYILPYFLEPRNESDEKIDELQSSVRELKDTLSETVCGIQVTLDSVQKLLKDQQQKVQNLSLSLSTSQSCLTPGLTDTYSLSEVKSELSSLKGLLLSRQQFPSPVVQSTPFPSIPAWQRSDVNATRTLATADQETNPMNGEPKLMSIQNGAVSNSDPDSSSGTLEVQDIQNEEGTGDKDCFEEPSDTSFSTMSSDVGSPNLSLSELKESLSETYVKVPTD